MINIPEEINHILKIVKARFSLKDKSEAITLVVAEYGEGFLEPELRPGYVKKAKEIMKEKTIHLGTIDNLRKTIGLK